MGLGGQESMLQELDVLKGSNDKYALPLTVL